MDCRCYAPATQRNRLPILAVLERVLPGRGVVLEVASGTGEHSAFFAPRLSPRSWLPSDVSKEALVSIRAWRDCEPSPFLLEPIELDVRSGKFSHPCRGEITAIVNINMIHISPWSATEGLLDLAQQVLPVEGVLYLYGPFRRHGKHTADSNAAFDQSLRLQDPSWGVRDLEEVSLLAEKHGLERQEIVEMPANNLSIVFRKISSSLAEG